MIPSIQNLPPKRKSRSVSTFLRKTYQLLNDSTNKNAVKWAPNGIGFIIISEQNFSKIVLPKYFKHSNYSSFVRQLNMYNFHKIRQGNQESYFHHQYFDRSNQNALSEIKRKPEKKKRKSNEDQDYEEEYSSIKIQKPFYNNKQNADSGIIEPVSSTVNNSLKYVKNQDENQIQNCKKTDIFSPTTKQLFSSQFSLKYECLNSEVRDEVQNFNDQGNYRQNQNEEDNISINNSISEIVVRFPTKELMYPSKNNLLFPFRMNEKENTFNIFY